MKSPTPDPIPHFETTSSMKRTSAASDEDLDKEHEGDNSRPTPRLEASPGPAGYNQPRSCGRASSIIMTKTRNFWAPWKNAWSLESERSILIISAPTRSCRTIWSRDNRPDTEKNQRPWGPGKDGTVKIQKVNRVLWNPKRGTFARAKYSTRIPRVHQIYP